MKKNDKEQGVKRWLHTKMKELDKVPALPEDSYGSGSHLAQDGQQEEAQAFSSYQKADDTCIGSSAIILSGITSEQNIQVDGICKGDVQTDRNVMLSGKIEGNVSGQNIYIYSGAVQGNIIAEKKVILNTKGIVIGNIQCQDIEADGKIKGNIQAENMAVLKSEAIIQGNISAQAIHTDKGAVINGKVTMISPKSEKEIFALPLAEENEKPVKAEENKKPAKTEENEKPAKTEENEKPVKLGEDKAPTQKNSLPSKKK